MFGRVKRIPELLSQVGLRETIRRGYCWAHFQTIDRFVGLPVLVSELGLSQSVRLLRQWVTGREEVTVLPRSLGKSVNIRRRDSDYYVFRDAILLRDSDPPLAREPRLIVDGGANVGYTTLVYSVRYPNAKIIAVEPDKRTAAVLRKQCLDLPNVQVLEAAIWSTNGTLELVSSPGASWTTKVREADSATTSSVRAITIPELMSEAGVDFIDLLKLDVEGAEREIFGAPDVSWLASVRVLVIELHGSEAHDKVHRALARYSFTLSQRGEKLICTRNGS
jgi:FkbM family methyltransferase